MSPVEALVAVPLWAAAGAFIAAIVARIVRDIATIDPKEPYDH